METIIIILSVALCAITALLLRTKKDIRNNVNYKEEHIILTERLDNAINKNTESENQITSQRKEIDELTRTNNELITEIKLVEQRIEQANERIKDWETLQEKMELAARSSVMKAGNELSNKLLNDHKRESESQQKKTEERISQTTQHFQEQFTKIFGSMDSLHKDVKQMDDIRQALLTPTGVGNIGEITLENILKASHLIKDVDYFLQQSMNQHMGGSFVRPDAIVRLPHNSFIVIDSKSSTKFFECINEERDDVKQHNKRVKDSVNQHLKDLVKKDYQEALYQHVSKQYNITEIGHIMYAMFLPTDPAIEKIRTADPHFMGNAWKASIMPVGPSGLINLMMQSRMIIANNKQERNLREITDEIQKMIDSVAKLHELGEHMGKSLKSSMGKYDAFASSFNGNFLSKVKRIDKMGIASKRSNTLNALERYRVDEVGKLLEANFTEEEPSDSAPKKLEQA